MILAQPGHYEASNTTQRPCPHCGRNVAVGEDIVVSGRDPENRWLPVDCYTEVWQAELAVAVNNDR